jgi:hypothetical protein
MANSVMNKEFPDSKQRYAVCNSYADKKTKNEGAVTMSKKNKSQENYQTVTHNFRPQVRKDTMEAKEYLVVPSIPIVEGVHNGSNGPLYYPGAELSKTPQVWNTKPVVVYHPEINGVGVSACDPDILTARKVGVMMNTVYEDSKLKTEVWLDEERCAQVDPRILEAVTNKEIMELSTGLFTDEDSVSGEWNDEPYSAIARNYRPDHLALLPDKIGACSVEDGAGFLRLNREDGEEDSVNQRVHIGWDGDTLHVNGVEQEDNTIALKDLELSHDSVRAALYSVLRTTKEDVFIEDIFDMYFVYADNGTLYKQKYTKGKKDTIKLVGIPIQVVRSIDYTPVTMAGDKLNSNQSKKEQTMDKNELIQKLIDNEHCQFGEEDRDFLEGCDVSALEKMNVPEPKTVANTGEDKATVVVNSGGPAKTKTLEELINETDKDTQDMIRNGIATYKVEKAQIIERIKTNERCTFTDEQLDAKSLDELKAIARLAVKDEPNTPAVNFAGQGDVNQNLSGAGPLPVPLGVLNHKEETKD